MNVRVIAFALSLTMAVLAILPSVEAQQAGKVYRIGWLAPRPRAVTVQQFVERARDLGWVEGENLAIECRQFDRLDEADERAAELVRLKVDLIVAQAPPAILAARKATTTIPIVMMYAGDPIRMGVATSLARPGGNVTGLSWDAGVEYLGKTLQLVKEALPKTVKIGWLWNLENDAHPAYLKYSEGVAPGIGVKLVAVGVRTPQEIDGAFNRMRAERVDVVYIPVDPFTLVNRKAIMDLVSRHRLPTMVGGDWGFEGALLVYGPRHRDTPRRAADYADRILRGARPGDVPIEQPREYDLIVDLRVAKGLGLTVARPVLLRADRVIE